ncbi:aldolase [Sinomonas sp. P47F7]|uniref:aldolase n=1 Tax=Sinomonas sp. P47F7 TaxID=3410987 RepID=UPI003BF487BD
MITDTKLDAFRRASGAFAVLALDQREALRAMMSAYRTAPVTDEEVRRFKLEAARVLTPHASGVLLDRQFALDQAIDGGAVSPGCGLIAAADRFDKAHGETVGETAIDLDVGPERYAALGVKALKLLVLYRPDGNREQRVAMALEFIERCREAGLASILEPVSRRPLNGARFDHTAGIIDAAAELGRLGADLYKAEVPYAGQAPEAEVRSACARLTELVDSPWVVLSSGVPEEYFPQAVRWACAEGASGFLAGRAIWASCLGAADVSAALREGAADRLRRLCDLVDEAVG